jgi:hypothetical protein
MATSCSLGKFICDFSLYLVIPSKQSRPFYALHVRSLAKVRVTYWAKFIRFWIKLQIRTVLNVSLQSSWNHLESHATIAHLGGQTCIGGFASCYRCRATLCTHFFKPPSEKEILKMNWSFFHPALGHSRFHFFFFRKAARAFAVFLLDG